MELSNSVLNDIAEEATLDEATAIINGMTELMFKSRGVGIAAPQVGISKRVVICVINGIPVAMINPKIIKASQDKKVAKEGCLSVPDKIVKVKRSKSVTVSYMNKDGDIVTEAHSNKAARVIQHEIDHLEGITI